jgi:conjugal transfer ATP-binding protein TraC
LPVKNPLIPSSGSSAPGFAKFHCPVLAVCRSHIKDYVDAYKQLKVRDVPLVKKTTEAYSAFLLNAVGGIDSCAGIPLRNFRLFVSVKIPLTDKELDHVYAQSESYTNLYDVFPWIKDLYANLGEVLAGATLYPQPFKPTQLIDMMRRLLNDREFEDCEAYDETIPIRKQMLMAETVSHKSMSELKIGDKYFRCITPKSLPSRGDPLQTNELFGGIWGIISDADQIRTPFLYTLNIIYHNVKNKLHGKCNFSEPEGGRQLCPVPDAETDGVSRCRR